jgi:hypothetical protein
MCLQLLNDHQVVVHAEAAVSLNNRGLHLFTEGRFDQAISVFSLSLSIVKQALLGDLVAAKEDALQSAATMTPFCFFPGASECSCSDRNDEGEPFIFKRPIFILPYTVASSVSSVSHAYLRKLWYIQIFNLALSYQMNALQILFQHDNGSKSKTSELNLRKARDLYTAAAANIKENVIQLTLLEEMAVVNNLAQVHAALNETELSRQWFQHLASALMLWKFSSTCDYHDDNDEDDDDDDDRCMDEDVDDDDDDDDDDHGDDYKLDDFMSSVLQGILGHHEASPAAAA